MDFPGGAVVKTLWFHCKGHKFDPWLGPKIPHITQHTTKKEKTNKNTQDNSISLY